MDLCKTSKLLFLIISVGYVRYADSSDQPGNPHVTTENDSEEEDNFEVTETSETPSGSEPFKQKDSCDSIIFMKKNDDGILVPMDEKEYKLIFENPFKKIFIFQKNLEMLLCNYQNIFENLSGNPFTASLTYFKDKSVFIIRRKDEFIFIRYERRKWRICPRKRLGLIKLYTRDGEDHDVELGDEHFYVSLSSGGSLKYELRSSVNCTKVVYRDKLIWEQGTHEPCPFKIGINIKK